jgi:hypothetical protein
MLDACVPTSVDHEVVGRVDEDEVFGGIVVVVSVNVVHGEGVSELVCEPLWCSVRVVF